MGSEGLQMEIHLLKESRDFIERSRDEALAKVRDVSIQNQELNLEIKKLKLLDKSQLASIESELKLRTFEFGRCSLLLNEAEAKIKELNEENKRLQEKYDTVKDEFSRLKCDSENKIASLKLKMRDKASRLGVYEKLEEELDKIVLNVAALPDSCNANELLNKYGYGSNIPTTAKRRLQHSIALARRVMELEGLNAELKSSLFKERDNKQSLLEELNDANASLAFVTYPTSKLIDLILKRDTQIGKYEDEIKNLNRKIDNLTQSEVRLQKSLTNMEEYKVDIEKTIKKIHVLGGGDFIQKNNRTPSTASTIKRRSSRVTLKNIKPSKSAPVSTAERCPSVIGLHFTKPLTLTKIQMPKHLKKNNQ